MPLPNTVTILSHLKLECWTLVRILLSAEVLCGYNDIKKIGTKHHVTQLETLSVWNHLFCIQKRGESLKDESVRSDVNLENLLPGALTGSKGMTQLTSESLAQNWIFSSQPVLLTYRLCTEMVGCLGLLGACGHRRGTWHSEPRPHSCHTTGCPFTHYGVFKKCY